jgi:signal peptidase I
MSERRDADRLTKAAKAKSEGGLWETVSVIAQALLIALVVRTFLFQPFNIPSGSLIPTLLVGDFLFVSKYSYGYSKHSFPFSAAPFEGRVLELGSPQRGDIAVFKLPRDGSTDYIKRVVGLPGDRIQVVEGVLRINGEPVKEERIGVTEVDMGAGYKGRAVAYWETLPGGRRHLIHKLQDGRGVFNNTLVYQVPAGHYFMMGDNRDNSTDSRDQSVGYVPHENFVGRAEVIFFSIEEGASAWQIWTWPWSVRWERLLQRIR